MNPLESINPAEFRSTIPALQEKITAFENGEITKKEYKGFSGKYGTYAQRDGKHHMLRLRMTAGRVPKDKLDFAVDVIGKYGVDLVHFTTCQALQLHDLEPTAVCDIIDKALDVGIVTYGGGGDYPRNVMCSPLSGIEADEYFDVLPYAEAAADFLMHYIDGPKMPRKLKVAFSASPKNLTHATFRDLGFVARPDGTFDVYAAGGLGNKPRLGVKVGEDVPPQDILYYIKAMIETFIKYGNYENRAKARTRFMVEALGSEDAFRDAFQKELAHVKARENLTLTDIDTTTVTKTGDGDFLEETWNVIPQKQEGLYAVRWHPEGGSPDPAVLKAVAAAIAPMQDVELRIGPDETGYIINLNAGETRQILELIKDNAAKNPFEASVACIGASICQIGLRDSQGLLKNILKAVREAGIKDFALPQVHISGCPSSCGTHQVGDIGFRGAVKMVDKKPRPAFAVFVYGDDEQGKERLGTEIGTMEETKIPEFLVALGKTVETSGKTFKDWQKDNPDALAELAKAYM